MSDSELKTIEIETHMGSMYWLPDYLGKVYVPVGAGPGSDSTFLVVNLSGASLSVPYRIIKKILVDGVIVWTGPNQFAA